MTTPTAIPISDDQIKRLQLGAVIIFPTETIYGIGCSAWCDEALQRIYKIKGRAAEIPPPILIHDGQQLSTLVAYVPTAAAVLMEKYWPGALTLIFPAHPDLPASLSGFSADKKIRTVGIRLTAHPISQTLCHEVNAPIIATSANFSGATGRAAAPESLSDIPQNFQNQVDIIVDGGVLRGEPSTVVDCTCSPPRVLRKGAISISEEELKICAA